MDRYERSTTLQTGLINNSAGGEADALAQELQNFTERRLQNIDAEAQRIGAQQGLTAGNEGQPEERSNLTISGQAFNKAAKLAHQAALQTDIRDSIGQLAIDHDDDPDTFQAKVAGVRDGLLKEAGPDYVPFIRQRVADYAGAHLLRVSQRQQAKLEKEAANDLQRGAEGIIDDMVTYAYQGDFVMVESRRKDLTEGLDEGVKAGFIEDGARIALLEEVEARVIAQDTAGRFNDVLNESGIDAATKMLQKWYKSKPSAMGVDVDRHMAIGAQMQNRLNTEKRLQSDQLRMGAAQAKAQKKQMTTHVRDHIGVLKDGLPIEQDDIAKTNEYVMLLGDPQLTKEYLSAIDIQNDVRNFRLQRDVDRAQEMTDLEREARSGGSVEEQSRRADKLAAFKAADADVTKQMAEDLRGFVNREGMLDDPPLDLANGPDAFAESLSLRIDSGNLGEALTGKPMPMINEAEAEMVSTMYEVAEIGEKLGILGAIALGAEDQALATFALLNEKSAGNMGVLGSLVIEGRGKLAGEIMEGQALMASEPIIKPKKLDYSGDVLREMGTALKGIPQARETYISAIIAKYAQLKGREHDLSEDYDRGLFRQAVQQVVPTAEYNDQRVMVPPGVSQQAFDKWVDSWTEDISTFYNIAGHDAQSLQERIDDDGYLVELGDGTGRYGVTLISDADGDPKPLVRKDGKKLVLEFTR